MIQAAIIGYGNIGSGVAEVMEKNSALLAEKIGEPVSVKYILDIRDLASDPRAHLLVKTIDAILEDTEVRIVVETMGGTNPAYDYVKRCLLAGKSVASSNKELVAKHGTELLKIARENNVSFLFEASAGGVIPIVRSLYDSITSDGINSLQGILNGTTNFMLTGMSCDGSSFDDVLAEAQRLGYAERNPEADVEGYDPCRKIAILTSMVFGKTVNYEEITTEGITKITDVDMEYASRIGYTIKLLACGYRLEDGKCFAIVCPQMIPSSNPLAMVNGVKNGILVTGDMMGELMFYGAGAGKLPTASAVVADVVEIAKNPGKTVYDGWTDEKVELADAGEVSWKYFVRLKKEAEDKISELFGEGVQVEIDGHEDEFAYITEKMQEKEFVRRAENAGGLVLGRIRMA